MLSRALRIACLLLLVPLPTMAQDAARSVVDDLLDRIVADINGLRYDEAITRGRSLTRQAATLSDANRARLHLLLAAAFYPAERPLQRPDSARRHLAAAVQVAPDAAYPAELRWRGLDSLLAATRLRTLAAVLRAPERQQAGGPARAATFSALASAPSDLELVVRSRESGDVVHRDRREERTTETDFRVPLHVEQRAVMLPGTYDALLIVRRAGVRDSAVVPYRLTVEAEPIALEPEPAFDESSLRPESVTPDRARTLRAAGLAVLGTAALGILGRHDADLRETFTPDSRAYTTGLAFGAVVTVFALRPRTRTMPANVAANAALRAVHARAVQDVQRRNADRLETYSGVIVFSNDGR
jgi:hypothetical protein